MKKARNIIISLAIPLGIGLLSGYLTADAIEIYKDLKQPFFSPPGWIFGPVWTVLYISMGYASFRIWEKRNKYEVKGPLIFYGIQLIFNFFWSIIFFLYQLRGLALVEIFVLLFFIIITTIKFYKIDRYSAYLLFPYIGWVSFATVLNYSIWVLNK
ncbi:MAG: TspO/MBR family protein [Bacillota bacterium]